MDVVRLYVQFQLLLTIFLVVLLWSLYVRLHRQEFFRWWAWAWTSFAAFLVIGTLLLHRPSAWTPFRSYATLLLVICGFLQVPLLAFGARSLLHPDKPARISVVGALGLTALIAAASFGWSLRWRAQPLTSFAIRITPRALLLSIVVVFCAYAFFHRWWRSRSWAAFITGSFCLLYAVDQGVYAVIYGKLVLLQLSSPIAQSQASRFVADPLLYFLDLVSCCGICLGMALVLVEDHQRTEGLLTQSDKNSCEIAASNAALQAEIQERKRVESALRESEDRYRDLVENSQDLICTHDLEGRLLSVNPAPARILGYEVQELLRMPMRELLPPEYRDQFEAYIAKIRNEGMAEGCLCVLTRNGERRMWEYHNTLRTEGVAVPIVRGLAHDVTERVLAERALRNSEQQLRQAQKMEAIGRLAGGLAHDFNNFLLGITLNLEQALRQLGPKDAPLMDYLDEALNAALSAASLTRRLLTFSRRHVFQPQPVNLNDVVITTKDLLDRMGGENIHIELRLQEGLGTVTSDPVQLQQVILNLMVNARDAMPAGGQITIRTEAFQLQKVPASEHFSSLPPPGSYVVLEVSDCGSGMDQETLSHLFEPFFTTKQAASASGLGLPICYGIVRHSGGHISVRSEVGRGTTVRVYLPLAERAGIAPASSPSIVATHEIAHRHSGPTVLVVDDSEVVRNAVARDLRSVGYAVMTASSSTEAVLLSDQHKGPIHLLVADVVMPGMNGRELARHLARKRPQMKVLMMTGYDKDTVADQGVIDPTEPLLYKPFSSLELLAALGRLLDKEAA